MAGDAAAYQAMRQMQARQRAQREARDDRRRQREERRPAATVGPAEALACPGCRVEYAFGNDCPDCDVRLVGASLAGASPPEAAEPPPRSIARRVAYGAAMGAVGLVATVVWLRLVYWPG